MVDQYLLIANSIRDFHHQISSKVLTNKKNAPKWEVESFLVKDRQETFVADFAPLLSLAETLEKLAAHHQALALPPEPGVSFIGGMGEQK